MPASVDASFECRQVKTQTAVQHHQTLAQKNRHQLPPKHQRQRIVRMDLFDAQMADATRSTRRFPAARMAGPAQWVQFAGRRSATCVVERMKHPQRMAVSQASLLLNRRFPPTRASMQMMGPATCLRTATTERTQMIVPKWNQGRNLITQTRMLSKVGVSFP